MTRIGSLLLAKGNPDVKNLRITRLGFLRKMMDEHALLGVILVLAASVRLTSLDLGWFLQDQVRDGMAALGILSGREFPLVGPQAALSTINLVGPLYYYLLAFSYGLSPDPTVGTALISLLNLLSVYLTYRLGTEMFGEPVGLVAAALYAVFPMAIFSSKALWNPGFIPFFAVLFLWTLWRFVVGRQPWTLAAAIFLLSVLLQMHMSGAIFVILLPIALLLYRAPVRPGPVAVGCLTVLGLYAPYILFQVRQGFPDLYRLLAWMGPNPAQSFWLVASRGFWSPFLLPERFAVDLPGGEFPWLLSLVQRAELVLLGLALLVLVARLIKAADRRPYVLLALWLALPFAIFPQNKIGVMWYYFDILYPAQFLAIGVLLQALLASVPCLNSQHISDRAGLGISLLVSSIMLVQVWFIFTFEGEVKRAGILSLPQHILLSFAEPRRAIMTTMPTRHKRDLARYFQQQFNVGFDTLEQKGHGAVYQLFREDKGFLFGSVPSHQSQVQPDPTTHYLLLRHDPQLPVDQGRTLAVGPYKIVAYQPTIRYKSWRWSASAAPQWWRAEFDDAAWSPVALPARKVPNPGIYEGIPYVRWSGKTLVFRGWMDIPSVDRSLWLALNIRHSYSVQHDVTALYLNGQALQPSQNTPYDTVNSRNTEVLVDVTSALQAGPNLLAFEITGMNDEFDLDVYELWVARYVRATP
jgi:4-amino-4-deoxy-L-arabinose transferase-like glycosyltransferase